MTNRIATFITDTALVEGHDGRAFGLSDNKGREIGARSSITHVVGRAFVPGVDKACYNLPALETYRLDVQATRGGKDYGPSFNRTHHLTLADTQKAKEAYFKSAAKRAQKTATK